MMAASADKSEKSIASPRLTEGHGGDLASVRTRTGPESHKSCPARVSRVAVDFSGSRNLNENSSL